MVLALQRKNGCTSRFISGIQECYPSIQLINLTSDSLKKVNMISFPHIELATSQKPQKHNQQCAMLTVTSSGSSPRR